jgi:serine/threonine-protein kinase
MGEIFLARLEGAAGFEKLYVVKRILPHLADDARFRQMLISEAQIAAKMAHANICQVYELGETAGQLYIVMEYLEGVTMLPLLRRASKQQAHLEFGFVAAVATQTCDALHYAHELKDRDGESLGLVHRDVTPSNIMLCERGGLPDVVKVLDFGLVQGFRAEIGTTQQITYGTPHYMAPEAITEPKIGPTGDLYALGCVAYFLVTGKPVFDGKTQLDILMKHASDAPLAPSRATVTPVPAELEAVILRCLAKQPADRFPSAAALAEALSTLAYSDWNEELARAWWRERANSDDASDVSRSDIITVDIEHREGLAS